MPWDMTAVEAPASAVRVPADAIPGDVVTGVEEAYTYCQVNPLDRIVITFPDTRTRELTAAQIRSYCQHRPAGQISASLWAQMVDPQTKRPSKEASAVPALSMFFGPYTPRGRKPAGNGQPVPETPAAGDAPAETPFGSESTPEGDTGEGWGRRRKHG